MFSSSQGWYACPLSAPYYVDMDDMFTNVSTVLVKDPPGEGGAACKGENENKRKLLFLSFHI
jgi:hypothetical protein